MTRILRVGLTSVLSGCVMDRTLCDNSSECNDGKRCINNKCATVVPPIIDEPGANADVRDTVMLYAAIQLPNCVSPDVAHPLDGVISGVELLANTKDYDVAHQADVPYPVSTGLFGAKTTYAAQFPETSTPDVPRSLETDISSNLDKVNSVTPKHVCHSPLYGKEK